MRAFKKRIVIVSSAIILVTVAGVLLYFFSQHRTERVDFSAARYLTENTEPVFGNEWAAFALAKGEYSCARAWLKKYKHGFEEKIISQKGEFEIYTDYSRCIIACSALGYDPQNVCGYDLTEKLSDTEKVTERGINGAIFALLALDTCNGDLELKDRYISTILSMQHGSGGFGMSANVPSADVTAMALYALAAHTDRPDVELAVERAVLALSGVQSENGGFSSGGAENSQSLSQVIIALCALGIDLDDARFIKNGNTLYDTLMSYRNDDGGFLRTKSDELSSPSATVQVLQALNAMKEKSDEGNNNRAEKIVDLHIIIDYNVKCSDMRENCILR